MKNILGFVKENKKTIGMLAGAIVGLFVAKKVNRKINTKLEKIEKEYEEMEEVIETTHEMNLPEYTEEDYNNDKKINVTKKVVKRIGLIIGKLCISSIPSMIIMLDHGYRLHQLTLQGKPKEEIIGNSIALLPALILWRVMYNAS